MRWEVLPKKTRVLKTSPKCRPGKNARKKKAESSKTATTVLSDIARLWDPALLAPPGLFKKEKKREDHPPTEKVPDFYPSQQKEDPVKNV